MTTILLPTREPPETIIPTDAIAVAGSMGNSYAWGTWAQASASLANDLLLCGAWWLQVFNQSATFASASVVAQYQVGIGAAGAESPIAQDETVLHATYTHAVGANVQIGFVTPLYFEPVRIPAGTRVAVRFTSNQASQPYLQASYLWGYEEADGRSWPLDKIVRPHRWLEGLYSQAGAVRSKVTPDAAAGVALSSTTTAFSPGSWVELLSAASVTRPLLLRGVGVETDNVVGISGKIELGVGAAASEVAIARIGTPGRVAQLPSASGLFPLARPKLVLPGERIAARLGTSGAIIRTHNVHLMYDEIA